MRIVLISCVSKKKTTRSMAKDMYTSPLFCAAFRYAHKLAADKIFILSAKYGLLEETDVIEPYDETLNSKKVNEIKKWANGVLNVLSQKANLHKDEFVFLAGERYRKYLVGKLQHFSVPLEGLAIGKQLAFYKENL